MKSGYFSLRAILVIPFVALILLLALTIAGLSYRTGSNAVSTLADTLMIDMVHRVRGVVDNRLADAAPILEAAMPTTKGATLPPTQSLTDLGARFSIASGIQGAAQSYVYYGNEQGQFVGVNRLTANDIELRLKESEGANRRFLQYRDGALDTKQSFTEDTLFDPRKRPWYAAAKPSTKAIWTKVYVDYLTGELTTTFARAIRDAKGTVEGVVATDVSLRALNDFVAKQKVSERGVAFIVEANGDLIATSTREAVARKVAQLDKPNGVQTRVNARESTNQLVRESYAAFENLIAIQKDLTEPVSRSFELIDKSDASKQGETVHISLDSLREIGGLRWYTIVAVPRGDLSQDATRDAWRAVAMGAIAAVIAVLLGLWILNWVATDLGAIAAAMNKMRQGLVEKPVPNFTGAGSLTKHCNATDTTAPLPIHRTDEVGEVARQFVAMRHDLQTDKLTGIANRDTFSRIVERRLRDHHESIHALPFAVLFIDLNDFKLINDEFGHIAGDRVLQTIAERARKVMPEGDLLARYGGDEFVALIEGASTLTEARVYAGNLVAAISAPMTIRTADIVAVRASIGIAICPADATTFSELLRIADKRMYMQKRIATTQ